MPSILVIEDEIHIRDNLRRYLRLEGYDVVEAENGEVGLRLIREQMPALVICDVMMPELDGFSLLQILRADPGTATLPFVFLTASADRESLEMGQVLGADDYVTKPFNLESLGAVIRRKLAAANDGG